MNKQRKWLISYIVIDIICTGLGMGVPFFNILLGFPLGVFLIRNLTVNEADTKTILQITFRYACVASSITVLIMLLIWGPTISLMFDPTADLFEFGVPQILYTPTASFIGWELLMIVVSPILQLFTTIFAANVTILYPFKQY